MASSESARIAVFGAGYAGLVTGAGFAELGHSVVLRDVVPEKVERLQRGESPIFELADFGVVGDLFKVVPQAIEDVRKRK